MRNVILISIDCLRADHVGYTEDSKFVMSFLNEISKKGQTYHNCIISAPFTTASHASMLTGLYPYEHGIRHLNGERLHPNTRMIQHDLKDRDFSTHAIVSCFHMTHIGLESGFDTFKYRPSVKDDKYGRGSYNLAEVVTDRAIKTLSGSENDKNFLFLHYFDAHVHVGYEYESMYKEMLNYIDEEIQRLVDYCRGYKKETLFVITGDHGKKLYKGEHNFPCLNPRNPKYDPFPCDYDDEGEGGHGAELYDECMKVPLILYCTQLPTGAGEQGSRGAEKHGSKKPTCPSAHLPTNSGDKPTSFDTQIQISSLRIPQIIRDYARCLFPAPKYSDPIVCMETFSPDQLFKQGIPLIGIRYNEWKSIYYQIECTDSKRLFQAAEFYNLKKDPNEKNNIIDDYEILTDLKGEMTSFCCRAVPHPGGRRVGDRQEGGIWNAPPKTQIEDKVATRLKALGYI